MLIQRPLLTKATTSSLIMSVSDVMCQSMEAHTATDLVDRKGKHVNLQRGCPANVAHCASSANGDDEPIMNAPSLFQQDWNRTGQVAVTGFAFTGPIAHFWYRILEAVVTVKHRFVGLTMRLLLDALFFSPIAVAGYFTTRTILECTGTRSDDSILRQVERKLSMNYWGAVEASWKFWPVANVLNFSLVPVPFRVLYNNSLSIFWNTYLTHLNGQRLERVVEARASLPDFPKGHAVEAPCSCSHCRALLG
jgi:protein Mpv17